MDYFCLKSSGTIFSTPDNWLFVSVDRGIVDFYNWLTIRNGLDLLKGGKSGFHISIVKGLRPAKESHKIHEKISPKLLKSFTGLRINYKYSNQVKYNDFHAWVDVEPTPINEIRKQLGLPEYNAYHITLGRVKYNVHD